MNFIIRDIMNMKNCSVCSSIFLPDRIIMFCYCSWVAVTIARNVIRLSISNQALLPERYSAGNEKNAKN
jgi:hypothetical protein